MSEIYRPLFAIGAWLLLALPSQAGMDDTHRVYHLTGKVWIRQATLRYGTPGPRWYSHPRFGPWERLRPDETLSPVCEIRTDVNATVVLQTGDEITDLNKFPDDSYVHYITLSPHSAVRFNSQYDARHPALAQRLYGNIIHKQVKGKRPAAKH